MFTQSVYFVNLLDFSILSEILVNEVYLLHRARNFSVRVFLNGHFRNWTTFSAKTNGKVNIE